MKEILSVIQETFLKEENDCQHLLYITKISPELKIFNSFYLPEILKSKDKVLSLNPTEHILSKNVKSLGRIDNKIVALFKGDKNDLIWEDNEKAKLKKVQFLGYFNIENFIKNNCMNVNLEGLNMPGANLESANLSGALLKNANLSRSNLANADLSNIDFTDANLQGCDLARANLHSSILTRVDLRRANLRDADLRGCKFKKTALRGAELWAAYMWEVDLSDSFMDGVDISRADTRGSQLTNS